MALVKKHAEVLVKAYVTYEDLQEAIHDFESSFDDIDQQSHAASAIIEFYGGGEYLSKRLMLNEPHISKQMSVYIASLLSKMDAKQAPIESVMELLKANNAYTRNLGISILQNYGDSIQYYIVKFLIGDDRDLRIFAINVLGDVNFSESRMMLVELLEKETDINVAMTAVDYMGEIGEVGDITLLESLKERFRDAYADFAIDGAIRSIRG